jgi:hypothetical protein
MVSVIDDDGAIDDVAVAQTIETVVDVVEPDLLDRVLDLAALRQCHDLAEVAEISLERPVIRIFPGDKRKQRNVDLLPHQADGTEGALGREQGESELDGGFGADAVDDAVDVAAARERCELAANVLGRLASRVDRVVGAIALRDVQLVSSGPTSGIGTSSNLGGCL